ncbi:MAG: hypothetical protein GY896_08420 [Gammaproteobacteria bacterium]|nr:hypothetical protein [Gammaproteobacteria bacterium]
MFQHRGHSLEEDTPFARLSLAKPYADCMNLTLTASLVDQQRLRIVISNIKVV